MMDTNNVNTIRDGLEKSLLYIAENVNLSSAQEDRLVSLLESAKAAGEHGIAILDDVIAAIKKRVAGDDK